MPVDPKAPPVSSPSGPVARATIGGCTMDRVIGSGGMGVVWAGTDSRGKAVAIKLLRSSGNETARQALLARLRAVRDIQHPSVARMIDVGSEGGRDYVIMERVEGQSVADWLAAQPPPREVLATMLSAGRGLAAAHAAGAVHRNFTLHSILRGRDGRVAVTDFATAAGAVDPTIARTTSAVAVAVGRAGQGQEPDRPLPRQQDALLDSALTQAGVFVGTPGYMAPELFTGMPATAHSDQFAFCVAMWEAWTGQRPFHGENLDELEHALRAGAPPLAAPMSTGLHRALVRGLSAEPTRRWPDLPSLLTEIERTAMPRGHNYALAAAGAVALGCLVTLLALLRC